MRLQKIRLNSIEEWIIQHALFLIQNPSMTLRSNSTLTAHVSVFQRLPRATSKLWSFSMVVALLLPLLEKRSAYIWHNDRINLWRTQPPHLEAWTQMYSRAILVCKIMNGKKGLDEHSADGAVNYDVIRFGCLELLHGQLCSTATSTCCSRTSWGHCNWKQVASIIKRYYKVLNEHENSVW